MKKIISLVLVLGLGLMVWLVGSVEAAPMGTAFTYQGRLINDNKPADGLYDIAFVLFDAPEGPNEIYATGVEDLDIVDGYFTVELDFGSRVFEGNRRWLEAAVRPYDSNDPRAYVSLSPRIELTPAPYALYAKTAGGDNDWMLSGNDMYSLPSGNVGIGKIPSVKLDVDGDININSAYKIKGDTVLSTPGGASIFVGVGAGENTTGYPNTFVGDYAGYANTTGTWNTFVGSTAGYVNTTGSSNTFLGDDSGHANTTGSSNTFVGSNAGCGNTTGSWNTFLGDDAGYFNNGGYSNTFIGYYAGYLNTAGSGNVFIGFEAGIDETGSNKLYIANGRYDPNVLIYGDFSTGRVGIGTTSPSYELDVEGNIFVRGTEGFNAAGEDAIVHLGHPAHNIRGEYGTGVLISAYNAADALTVREGSGNVGIGTTSPGAKLDVNGDMKVTGAYKGEIGPNKGAPFPRPAYNSGWVSISADKTLTHNIGGSVDNYVVDLQIWHQTRGIYQSHYYERLPEPPTVQVTHEYGVYWSNLTSSSIEIRWGKHNFLGCQIRVRIWVYN